jgi:hypothetical protein
MGVAELAVEEYVLRETITQHVLRITLLLLSWDLK